MSTTIATQIKFFLSGGLNNSNPNKSLGGSCSSFPISGSVNNLFADITSEEARVGKVDFRCFYVKNTSAEESLYDLKMFINSQKSSGSTTQVGVTKITDTQELRVNGAVISGNLLLKYKQQQIFVTWGGSAATFSSNLNFALNAAGLGDIEISHAGSSLSNVFNLKFKGNLNYRNQPLLEVISNNLNGIAKPVVTTKKISEGQPINSLAPLLAVETVPPASVEFQNTSSIQQIDIGVLQPGDQIPVWIKRLTAPDTSFEERDYFTFKITGSPFI
jgi:hypothetical protein